jgi:hypothetical protein
MGGPPNLAARRKHKITESRRFEQAKERGFVLGGLTFGALEEKWWRHCKAQRLPYIVITLRGLGRQMMATIKLDLLPMTRQQHPYATRAVRIIPAELASELVESWRRIAADQNLRQPLFSSGIAYFTLPSDRAEEFAVLALTLCRCLNPERAERVEREQQEPAAAAEAELRC